MNCQPKKSESVYLSSYIYTCLQINGFWYLCTCVCVCVCVCVCEYVHLCLCLCVCLRVDMCRFSCEARHTHKTYASYLWNIKHMCDVCTSNICAITSLHTCTHMHTHTHIPSIFLFDTSKHTHTQAWLWCVQGDARAHSYLLRYNTTNFEIKVHWPLLNDRTSCLCRGGIVLDCLYGAWQLSDAMIDTDVWCDSIHDST